MEEKVREIFTRVCEGVDVNAKNMVAEKLIDSVQIVDLVTTIMEELGVEIPYEEIVPENFSSLESIVALVEKFKEK